MPVKVKPSALSSIIAADLAARDAAMERFEDRFAQQERVLTEEEWISESEPEPDMSAEALRYHRELDWWIVPQRGKQAVAMGWERYRLSENDLDAYLRDGNLNIAVELGHSGIIDVECDSPEAEAELQELLTGDPDALITPTWMAKRGLHRLYRRPDGLPQKAKVEVRGIEFRIGNAGALSTLPPSLHPEGVRYRWQPGLSVFEVEPRPMPQALIDLVNKKRASKRSDGVAHLFKIPEGCRNDELFNFGCRIIRAGAVNGTVFAALKEQNLSCCDPPLPEEEVANIAKSAERQAGGESDADCQPPVDLSNPPELALDPNIIDTIRQDIRDLGLVGEEDNCLLIYLTYTSRLLADPNSVILRGKSGAGKSTLPKRIGVLLPPSAKIEALSMTEAAWFNTPEDFFKHKVLIGGESKHSTDDKTKDAGAMLRQLLSEKKIDRGVSIYNEKSKRWKTEFMYREGPIAYAEGTTSGSIFEEDLNRRLQIWVDDSEQQNRRVMLAIGSKYDPDAEPADAESIIKRHHAFQNYLQALPTRRVGIPYYKALATLMPAGKTEIRRAIQQVFSIIESIVILRQHHREERNGCLIATLDDYALARQLLLPSLHASLGVGKEFKKAQALKDKLGVKKPFVTKQVKEAMGFRNDMGPSTLLNGLVDAGLLERMRERSGNVPAMYRWTELAQADLESMILPNVERLERAMGAI
jgi:hypothetical protein